MCIDRDCGECRILTQANARRVHRGAERVALFGVAVFLLGGGAAWILHALLIVATCLGMLIIGGGIGYGAIMWRRYQRRQLAQAPGAALARPSAAGRQLGASSPYSELPAASNGNDLHLHLHGADAAEALARVFRGER
jgi:hypothetical protein